MRAVLEIILIVLDLYVWLLIASAILSWLVAFNVVNTRNPSWRGWPSSCIGSPSRCWRRSARSCRISAASTFADHPDPDHHVHPELIVYNIYPLVF